MVTDDSGRNWVSRGADGEVCEQEADMKAEGVLGTFDHTVPPKANKTWGSTLVMPSKAEGVANSKVEVGCSKAGSSEEKVIWGRLFI